MQPIELQPIRDFIAEECDRTRAEWEPVVQRIAVAYQRGLRDELFAAIEAGEEDTPASWNAHLDKLLAGLNES